MQKYDLISNDNKYQKILNDIKDLNEINNNLCNLLQEQDEKIETICEKTCKSIDNLETSNINIIEASKFKLKTKATLIGAVLGSVVMGPTGVLIGTKCAIYMTAGGGILGSLIGNKLG